ncbi:MAG: glycosyltransferase family 4 protein [Planctomycetes bacterium]|nr:glycosyltransferase family 4 protein [Planctomycetota bacterium]
MAAASHRLCVSESQRRLLASLGAFDQRAVEVSPIGINPPAGGAPPAPPGSDRLRIVNWAGLDPRKGPQRLVEAVAGSVHRDRFRLRFHGRHGEADFMRELARLGDGLDLEFPGPFEDDDRRQFAAESDLAVFPFLAFETYGLVVDEALHLGLPVVVPNHGAPAERVGERGCVVARDDVLALRQALEALHASPERLLTMRRAPHLAGTLAAHFGHLATRYQELLEDA